MLDLLLGPPRRASTDGWGAGWFGSGGWFGRTVKTRAGELVNEERALTYSAVWGASRVVTEGVSDLPLRTFRRLEDDHREDATDFPLYDVLHSRPNPNMAAIPWRRGRTLHQINWGQGFAEIERGPRGEINLWPIHPSRVRPSRPGDRTESGAPVPDGSYIVRNDDGSSSYLLASEMLHIPGCLTEDGIWGKGVIQYARECIGFGLGTERYGANFFGNGALPRGVLKVPGFNIKDPEARKNFRQMWREVHAADDEIALIGSEGDFTPITVPNEAAQFLQTRGFNKEEIATWYGIPSYKLNAGAREAYNSIEAKQIDFVTQGVLPWVRLWESQLNFKLLSPQERKEYFIEFTLEGLLRGDTAARFNAYRIAIISGFMTLNEVRRLENLPGAGPAGDVLYLPVNMTTADRMAEGPVGQGGAVGSDQSGAGADGTPGANAAALDQHVRRLGLRGVAVVPGTRRGREEMRAEIRRLEKRARAFETAAKLPATVPDAVAVPALPAPDPLRAAARSVLTDTLSRLFTKEANAAQRAARKGGDFDAWLATFYAEHEDTLADALAPAASVIACAGVAPEARSLAVQLCSESKALLSASYDTDTPDQFAAKLALWPTDRAGEAADSILRSIE